MAETDVSWSGKRFAKQNVTALTVIALLILHVFTASIFWLVAPRTSNDIGFPDDWQLIFTSATPPALLCKVKYFTWSRMFVCFSYTEQPSGGTGTPSETAVLNVQKNSSFAEKWIPSFMPIPPTARTYHILSQASGLTVSCGIMTRT